MPTLGSMTDTRGEDADVELAPEDAPEQDEDGDMHRKTGRAIRHAMADSDDHGIGEAMGSLIKYHLSKGAQDDHGSTETHGAAKSLAKILSKDTRTRNTRS